MKAEFSENKSSQKRTSFTVVKGEPRPATQRDLGISLHETEGQVLTRVLWVFCLHP